MIDDSRARVNVIMCIRWNVALVRYVRPCFPKRFFALCIADVARCMPHYL